MNTIGVILGGIIFICGMGVTYLLTIAVKNSFSGSHSVATQTVVLSLLIVSVAATTVKGFITMHFLGWFN
ncbi:MAG TPA: hypothetical protein VJ201_04460 [Candidatus Babeliales bacterium]|nr:hypothetical protein [Candidatus Babeliales bacterium]